MKESSLRELYIEQLKDLYNAEQQLIKAIPKMAKAASSEELRAAFAEHLEKTKQHAQRIETVFETMGEKLQGKKCKAMEGLVKEGGEVIEEDMEEDLRDVALIAAAQRVEHYEIAGYGCVRTYATILGDGKAADLLAKTLQEEKDADVALSTIADQLNLDVPAEQASGKERTSERRGARASNRKSKSAA